MTKKIPLVKRRKIIEWFLELFPEYKVLQLETKGYQRKIISDANLIESLNRYIETLEKKAAYQMDVIKDLKKRQKEIFAKPKHQSKQKKRPQ